MQEIYGCNNGICIHVLYHSETMDLDGKIIISMAIRLLTEEYIIDEIIESAKEKFIASNAALKNDWLNKLGIRGNEQ